MLDEAMCASRVPEACLEKLTIKIRLSVKATFLKPPVALPQKDRCQVWIECLTLHLHLATRQYYGASVACTKLCLKK